MSTTESYNYDDAYNPLYFYLIQNTTTVKGWTESGATVEYIGRTREISRGNKVRLGMVYETAS